MLDKILKGQRRKKTAADQDFSWTVDPALRPCERCGCVQFWLDRYRRQLHCGHCEPPPLWAMVLRVAEAGLRFRDSDAIEYIERTEPDGRQVVAIRGIGERAGPPPGMSWEDWWEPWRRWPAARGMLS